MIKIRQDQMHAFRAPARAQRPARLLDDLQKKPPLKAARDETNGDIIVTDPRGHAARLSFAADGLPAKLTKPSGAAYDFEHDDAGRLSALVHPGGERVEMRRDAHGNIRELSRPGLGSYRFDFDDYSRLLAAHYPDGKLTRFTYAEGGQLTAITDRAEATTNFTRDAQGRLQAAVDPLGRRTRYDRNEAGALAAVEFPDGSRESYRFDPATNAAVITRRDGQDVVLSLTRGGALQAVAWPDQTISDFEFDARGNLAIARNHTETVVHSFDEAGNPLTEETSAGIVAYEYDAEGRLIGLTTPQGDRIEYEYDEDGRLSLIKDWEGRENRFVYAANGTIAELRYGNGLVETQEHARQGRLTRARVVDRQGKVLSEQTYEYDLNERLTGLTDSWGDAARSDARRLHYDAEYRLLQESNPATGQPLALYAYDAKGNMTASNAMTIEVGPLDEPVKFGASKIEYDALGNMRRLPGERGELRCEFYGDGLLRAARTGAQTLHFAYDSFARRVLKTDGSSTTRYGWAGQQLLWEEFQAQPGDEPVRRDYIFVPDGLMPVAFRERGRTYWLQSDARGAVIRVFDETGKTVWRARYSSFGRIKLEVNEVRQPFRFFGHYYDEETGLHYNHARYYSPLLRSYISRDPNWHLPGATNYSYARNDPWNRADPFGAIAPLLVAAGAVALGGLVGGAIGAVTAAVTGGDPIAGAVEGGVAGMGTVLGGLLGGPVGAVVGGIAGDVVGAFAGSLIEQARKGDPISIACALKASGIALAIDLLTLGLGRIPGVKRLVRAVGEKLFELGAPLRNWARESLERLGKSVANALERAMARRAGMQHRHLQRLKQYCQERGRMVVVRFTNPESLKYHGKEGFISKPVDVKLKTAKEGPQAGLVTRPKEPMSDWERENIEELTRKGYKFDEDGVLRDPSGNKIHGDYDIQGSYQQADMVNEDGTTKKVYLQDQTNDSGTVADMNEHVAPERDMFRHGANDNYEKIDPATGERKMGRNPGADEEFLVVDPDGNARTVNSTPELQQVYEANGIEWPYD